MDEDSKPPIPGALLQALYIAMTRTPNREYMYSSFHKSERHAADHSKLMQKALSSRLKGHLVSPLTLGAFLACLCCTEADVEQVSQWRVTGNSPNAGPSSVGTSPASQQGQGHKAKAKRPVTEANFFPFSRRVIQAGTFDVILQCIRKAIVVSFIMLTQ